MPKVGDISKVFKQYFALQKNIHQYFGYVEDWRVIPLEDSTSYWWSLEQDETGHGVVRFGKTKKDLLLRGGDWYYENIIYTQRFLPKWVYPAKDYTLVCVDTQSDLNYFLQIFDNKKKVDEGQTDA